ncbi:uncharacterized protein MELLADRAFT_74183 [Melampsora larici-populina 98AG31]|uniref:Uncharacterized protein n=1 Tax=Melampsora larici-populina (strain 98AG31 / pathotype 3-4-7) TaxID=747676 RepID=F4RAP1_MELLP|nr:uncharacterized protein MELLADRAFT_74183 [Melampsora larici-populina 98AG31]EGG10750.1 hypothetical protein MELLADRAFT_74183 [Melampsora larici-populina 98AG31]
MIANPVVLTTSSTISIEGDLSEDGQSDDLSDSDEPVVIPPTWTSLRFTHLVILIPLSLLIVPVLALLPISSWYSNGLDSYYSFFKTFFTPFWMGCLGFLACFGLKKSIVESLIQFLSRRQHRSHSSRNALYLALCLIFQVTLTELLRLAILINQKDRNLESRPSLSNVNFQHDLRSFPARQNSTFDCNIYFFIAFWVGLGWSLLELLVLGCSDWIHQVLLYKHVLLENGEEEEESGIPGKGKCSRVVESTSQLISAAEADHLGIEEPLLFLNGQSPNLSKTTSTAHDHLMSKGPPASNKRVFQSSSDVSRTPDTATFSMSTEGTPVKLTSAIKSNVQIGEGTYHVIEADAANLTGRESSQDEDVGEIEQLRAGMESLERQSVEQAIGLALWQIPWFIVWIWRLNSALLTVTLSLILAKGVFPTQSNPTATNSISYMILVIIFKSVIVILWSFQAKSIGVVKLTYITLIICLIGFVGCLGLWGFLT